MSSEKGDVKPVLELNDVQPTSSNESQIIIKLEPRIGSTSSSDTEIDVEFESIATTSSDESQSVKDFKPTAESIKETQVSIEPHSHYVREEPMTSQFKWTTYRDPLDPSFKDTGALVLTCEPFDSTTGVKRPSTPPENLIDYNKRLKIDSQALRSQWNFERIFTTLGTNEQCIEFAVNVGLIASNKQCSRHRRLMNVCGSSSTNLGYFRCKKSCPRGKIARATGTWFENTRLSYNIIFRLMYCYAADYTFNQTLRECSSFIRNKAVSSTTVTEWFGHCRKVVVTHFTDTHHSILIGGTGKVVQIGERHFIRENRNSDKRSSKDEGHWVIGMIEDGRNDLRLATYPDNKRDAETMVSIIQKYVLPGTTIVTNGSPSYSCLSDYGYSHNPFPGSNAAHIQRIKSHWRGLKKRYNKTLIAYDFDDWLVEYCWRKHIKDMNLDPFDELIFAVKYVYKPK